MENMIPSDRSKRSSRISCESWICVIGCITIIASIIGMIFIHQAMPTCKPVSDCPVLNPVPAMQNIPTGGAQLDYHKTTVTDATNSPAAVDASKLPPEKPTEQPV